MKNYHTGMEFGVKASRIETLDDRLVIFYSDGTEEEYPLADLSVLDILFSLDDGNDTDDI